MAYVNIYYHREPSRLGKHVRYIAERPGSTGRHGLGPEFRRCGATATRLCVCWSSTRHRRARRRATARARGRSTGCCSRSPGTWPGAWTRRRGCLRMARLVLQDAIEATFRSAGRELQGVHAIHFQPRSATLTVTSTWT